MKLSVTVSSSKVVQDPFIIWHGFEESFAKARDYGFAGVELSYAGKSDIHYGQLEKLLMKYGMEVSCISTGLIFSSLGLYLTHPNVEIRSRALSIIYEMIDFASDFGQRINIGRSRGYYDPVLPKEQCEAAFIDTLSRIVDRAEGKNVTVLVEPVNRYEINFINTFQECAALLQWVPGDTVGILGDTFHMNIEEQGIGDTLVQYGKQVKHIHIADNNRKAPGWGHIDFDDVFDALKKIHFDGWIALEAIPLPTPDAAAKQGIEFLTPYIEAHNRHMKSNGI